MYIARDNFTAQLVKDYLASCYIESIIKGELLIGAVGEIPANTFPTVWILEDDDYDKALELVKSFEAGFAENQLFDNVWKCESCNELIEAQFTQCWKCGNERVR